MITLLIYTFTFRVCFYWTWHFYFAAKVLYNKFLNDVILTTKLVIPKTEDIWGITLDQFEVNARNFRFPLLTDMHIFRLQLLLYPCRHFVSGTNNELNISVCIQEHLCDLATECKDMIISSCAHTIQHLFHKTDTSIFFMISIQNTTWVKDHLHYQQTRPMLNHFVCCI